MKVKYPNTRIFQGNELLVLAVKLFDAGRAHERDGGTDEERRATVTQLVQDAETKIAVDEPVFVLRGQDPYAGTGIVRYARLAEDRGAAQSYVESVVNHAVDVDDWQQEHPERVKGRPD
jgi:hypothetical protein